MAENRIEFIRNGFQESVDSRHKTQEMISYFEKCLMPELRDEEPLFTAYYGSLTILLVKHGFNPFTRLSNLRDGMEYLDRSVALRPRNIEIRFLRFSTLVNLPALLGYTDQLKKDTVQIFLLMTREEEQMGCFEDEMRINMISSVIESGRLNERQQQEFEQLFDRWNYENE
ncbi:MAG: hypothetical protein WDZ29_03675 [Balneolaceae bacterium]